MRCQRIVLKLLSFARKQPPEKGAARKNFYTTIMHVSGGNEEFYVLTMSNALKINLPFKQIA